MRNILFTILISIFSISANATWVEVEIIEIKAFTSQNKHFMRVRDFSSPNSCKLDGHIFLKKDSGDNWEMVHSLIMAGFLSGKKIEVRTSGCGTNYTEIDGAKLVK